jgi:hypothetical protein
MTDKTFRVRREGDRVAFATDDGDHIRVLYFKPDQARSLAAMLIRAAQKAEADE